MEHMLINTYKKENLFFLVFKVLSALVHSKSLWGHLLCKNKSADLTFFRECTPPHFLAFVLKGQ